MDYDFQDMLNLASIEELFQNSDNITGLSLLEFDFLRDNLGLLLDFDIGLNRDFSFHDLLPLWFGNETWHFSEHIIDYLYDELLDLDNNLEDQVQPNGLSQDIIERLSQKTQIDTMETCTICKDNYKEDDYIINLPCDHYFHKSCLVPWFESHSTCPMCRKIVS